MTALSYQYHGLLPKIQTSWFHHLPPAPLQSILKTRKDGPAASTQTPRFPLPRCFCSDSCPLSPTFAPFTCCNICSPLLRERCLGIMCLCVRVCAHVCMRTGRVSLLVAMGHCLQGFALHGNWGSYLCICTSSNINQWCVPFG